MKDVVFLSHANPEDNEITLWLALQIGAAGYKVWCDLVQLMGGEDTWRDIEQILRERTAKFIYVLSCQSNGKPGALKELQLAENVQRKQSLRDFILPVAVDDLSPQDYNIQLARLHALNFRMSWALGLTQVLDCLCDDGIPCDPAMGPQAVSAWWRAQRGSNKGVQPVSESMVSNVFPVRLPPLLLHELEFMIRPEFGPGAVSLPESLPAPGLVHGRFLVSFATSEAFSEAIGSVARIRKTRQLSLAPDAVRQRRELWSARDEENALTRLLNQAWDRMVGQRSLPTYPFANRASALYFQRGMIPKDEIEVISLRDQRRTHRQVIGYKTLLRDAAGTPTRLRYWHFALEARPIFWPELGYVIKPHVLFSDDGRTLWSDKLRMHRAGRAQRKNWWNDHWRDLILGTMRWLAGGTDTLSVPVSDNAAIEVAATPLLFSCPVSFDDGTLVEQRPDETSEEDIDEEDLAEVAEED